MGAGTVRRRALPRLIATLAALLLLQPSIAGAWGYFGHETTARIALANVRPETRTAIARLIAHDRELGTPDCRIRNLADAATWPDCLRREGWRWGYTFAWHYQTQPVDQPYDLRRSCSGGNCVTAQIERNQRILADETLPANVRLEALAFMVHFAGDIHMPLHSGDNDDRGGNDVAAQYGIVPGLNLHSIWDGALAERAVTAAIPPLVRRYSPAERAALGGGDSAQWGAESHALARDFVYPNAFGSEPPSNAAILTQEAIVAAVPVAERRIVQAGIRIAGYLDAAFAPGPLPEPERRP
ncbi:S1/P1 Nuclease [Tsuneonella dongtanensis]|uniref:S1/P1 Nuclease n=1 Tax=Tsuneonella dongtanensis TaxID=692370 RepID=A0A1B2A8Z6_9SPHN|nr:S1/P1 nuclease [Tsuneonella dongtanensis]ANY18548.1 S1/P1 Nuclease [Tsuneonella dongtanensis]